MYDINDTIVAISSPASARKVIIRITGPETIEKCQQIFTPEIPKDQPGIISGWITVDDCLKIEAKLYLFLAGKSYTGHELAEICMFTNSSVTEALMDKLLGLGLRMAGPGEFTARAYLNGKIDLTQAEAVNEVITCSNRFQLEAAEKLLTGELAQTTSRIRSEIMECLTFLEAGLDFSGEDIEFITAKQAVKKLTQIKAQLEQLLADSIRYESVIDLPAVGIAGAPNAGKSSLLNKLLGKKRSIVSNKRKTTRDVLTGTMTLPHSRCVLFDCAGLIAESDNILDELAHQAAVNAIDNSLLTLLCIDVSKTDWTEDLTVRQMIETNNLIPVATKCDLLDKDLLADQLKKLKKLFGIEFLATSTKTNTGIDLLGSQIDKKIIESLDQSQYAIEDSKVNLGLTARQKHAVTQAVEYIGDSINELSTGNDEVVAMMLRSAYQGLSHIEQENINERILDNIFSKFCIGK